MSKIKVTGIPFDIETRNFSVSKFITDEKMVESDQYFLDTKAREDRMGKGDTFYDYLPLLMVILWLAFIGLAYFL